MEVSNTNHESNHSYKKIRFVRLANDEGTDPLNWLTPRSLFCKNSVQSSQALEFTIGLDLEEREKSDSQGS